MGSIVPMTWCLNTRLSPDYLLEVRLGLSPEVHLHHVVALLDVREVAEASLTVRAQCGLGTPLSRGALWTCLT